MENGKKSYTLTNTGETREINKQQHITCNLVNLTYVIECRKRKKQYIGVTKGTLRKSFTERRSRQAVNNPSHANADAAEPSHFTTTGH